MEKNTIKLRSHHISTMEAILLNQSDINAYAQDPTNREVAVAYKNALENFNFIERVYRGTAMPELRRIAGQLLAEPATLIEIVEGADQVCNSCVFADKCSRGDYSEVLASYSKNGFPRKGNPIEADTKISVLKKIRPGEIYTAKELFPNFL